MAAILQASEANSVKPSDYYRLYRVKGFYSTKFKTYASDYNVHFDNLSEIPPEKYAEGIKTILDDILSEITGRTENKYARFYMDMPALKNPISIPYIKADELTSSRILEQIQKIQNSNDKVSINGDNVNMHISCTDGDSPGAGWSENGSCRSRTIISLVEWLRVKKGAIQIKNNDKLCLARALVVAKAHCDNHANKSEDSAAHYRKIRHPASPFQKECALKLHEDANVPLKACGLSEIQLFQNQLEKHGYRIIIYSAEENFEKMFTGPQTCRKLLHIIKHSNHFDVITKPAALFNTSYYCEACLTGLNHIETHNCLAQCKACKDATCKTMEKYPTIKCDACRRYFYTHGCLQNHKNNGICATLYRCELCNNQISKGNEHLCNTYTCSHCSKKVETGHLCYIQKPKTKNSIEEKMDITFTAESFNTTAGTKRKLSAMNTPSAKKLKAAKKKPVIYYYDIETMQETSIHVPNLIVVQREDSTQWIYEDTAECSARDAFCNWIFKKNCEEIEPVPRTFIAHYGKGFDSYFVLEYIHQHCIYPAVIKTGSKYMLIEVPQLNIKFIDSHNFISTPLKAFPKMFELSELKKGYFPHLFNTAENKNYIGEIPPIETYNPQALSTVEYMQFIAWYSSQKKENIVFNMQEELKAYCISDVQILRQGCEKFRTVCIEAHQMDPFETSITIASYCHKVYRTHYMPEDTIGIIPAGGYGRNTQYSTKALHWLKWIAHSEKVLIKHARNGGEEKIGPYYVDGFCPANKVVYEFQGCLYHGCSSCYDEDAESPLGHGRMGDIYAKTEDRIRHIQSLGFETRVIWECEYSKMLKTNSQMADYISSIKIISPLNPRDAFYGGRTDVSKLHCEASDNEEIHYLDFVSLYPTINKYGRMPVGHPDILLPDNKEEYLPGVYYGFAKCKVLPPQDLYHPVLPCKSNGKLIFSLCNACMDTLQSSPCRHSETERALIGTWTTPELDVAIGKGYKVQEVYEIWHYPKTAEHGCQEYPDGLFGRYVDAMLKNKQEASGWPEDRVTDEQKDAYITEYHAKEGILLDKKKISYNSGQRNLSKLMLNSLWGKFGQRNELPKTEYVTSRYRLLELIKSKEVEVQDSLLVNSEMMMVTYITKDDQQKPSSFTSVPIAAFTTALARLKLYSVLDIVQDKAVYMDTDSIIYLCKPTADPLSHMIGTFLGDMTDEIGTGHHIKEFVSGGPKNYAYETSNGKKTWKIKGITQNFKTDSKINYDVIKAMVTDKEAPAKVVLTDRAIKRNTKTTQIFTVSTTKSYGIAYDKGVVDSKLKAWPYGYTGSKEV